MEKVKNKGGRPSSFTQAKADKICNMLIGGKSMRAICKDDELPACSTVYKWLADIKEFSEQYAHAREMQADALFDEILEIADETSLDTIIGDDGIERTNHEAIQRSRLRVDARKWMAGKLRPKKYGDKTEVEHTGTIDLKVRADAARFTSAIINLTDRDEIASKEQTSQCGN